MVKTFTNHYDTVNTYATIVSDHLSKTAEGSIVLEDTHANIYHNFGAKALFPTNRSRLEIRTAVAFLRTLVRATYKDEQKKLSCMIRYLRGIPDLLLNLYADITNIFKWGVDVSHGVHYDYKWQTGATK